VQSGALDAIPSLDASSVDQARLEQDFTRLENHLISDDRFLAEVYPSSIQAARHIAVLEDPMAFETICLFPVLLWTSSLIAAIRARGGSRYELETAVALG
jgi:hypothetical protein